MLFNSYIYILFFLPTVVFIYYLFHRWNSAIAKVWLLVASLVFYSYWNISYLPLILISIATNFFISELIYSRFRVYKKTFLAVGIVFNLGLLGFFKYVNFFLENVNHLLNTQFSALHFILPLAISFFTFQQIAYLVDSYKGVVEKRSFLAYGMFVTFFPHLIAGPLLNHREVIPQFEDKNNFFINYSNVSKGVFIFFIGLAKKVVLADTLAVYANAGFSSPEQLSSLAAWLTSLSYTLQLYFDFSGYTDMAIGSALLFNIILPINFNSPYKATNIQEFWRRWHMTLGRIVREYMYIPLGGSRVGNVRTCINLVVVFLVVGLWHGAAWTFIFWGLMHGVALVIHHMWEKTNIVVPNWLGWFVTFNFVNIGWILFRAESFSDASIFIQKMFSFGSLEMGQLFDITSVSMIVVLLITTLVFKNSIEQMKAFRPTPGSLAVVCILFFISFCYLNTFSEFLYFNF